MRYMKVANALLFQANTTNRLNVGCFFHVCHMGFTIMHKILLITLAGTKNKSTKFRVILRQCSPRNISSKIYIFIKGVVLTINKSCQSSQMGGGGGRVKFGELKTNVRGRGAY